MSKCKYPNCNNFNGSDFGLCDFHFRLWQVIPDLGVEDWCVKVFEEQNAKEEQPTPACAKFGCGEQPVSGSNFCVEHSPTWPEKILPGEPSGGMCDYPDCISVDETGIGLCRKHREEYWRTDAIIPQGEWLASIRDAQPEVKLCAVAGCNNRFTRLVMQLEVCADHAHCHYPDCSRDATSRGFNTLLCTEHQQDFMHAIDLGIVPRHATYSGFVEQTKMIHKICGISSPTPERQWPRELLGSFSDSQATPIEINKIQPTEKESEKSILEEANEIVNGSRATDYGDAVESFKKISILATAMSGEVLSPLTCCLVLKAVKLARESNTHKRDNLVDECGYAELENRIKDWQNASEDECIRHNGLLNEILWGAEEGM